MKLINFTAECKISFNEYKKVLVVQSCPTLWPHGLQPARLLCPWVSLGKNIGVGCHAFLQEIFLFFYFFRFMWSFLLFFFICSEFCHTLKWNSHGFTGDLSDPGIKPGLLCCRQILYHLSHQGSPSMNISAIKYRNDFTSNSTILRMKRKASMSQMPQGKFSSIKCQIFTLTSDAHIWNSLTCVTPMFPNI